MHKTSPFPVFNAYKCSNVAGPPATLRVALRAGDAWHRQVVRLKYASRAQ